MSKYSEKLKDPRWQKKRLKIMEKDDFKCQICFSKDKTLNVHHYYYKRGRNPWEYEDESLVTICQDCHEKEHESEKFFKDIDYNRSFTDFRIPKYTVRRLFVSLNELHKIKRSDFYKSMWCLVMVLCGLAQGIITHKQFFSFIKKCKKAHHKKVGKA